MAFVVITTPSAGLPMYFYFKKLYFKFQHIKCKASFSHYFALGNKVKVANEVFREYEIKILNFLDEIYRKNYFQSKQKIGLLRATLAVTDYIKLFHTGVDRHSDILTSLLLLVGKQKAKLPCKVRFAVK